MLYIVIHIAPDFTSTQICNIYFTEKGEHLLLMVRVDDEFKVQ